MSTILFAVRADIIDVACILWIMTCYDVGYLIPESAGTIEIFSFLKINSSAVFQLNKQYPKARLLVCFCLHQPFQLYCFTLFSC